MVKRTVLFTFMALGAAVFISAQGMQNPFPGGRRGGDFFPAETVTVSGTLTIAEGMIALTAGEITYLVPGLIRFAGFIDSIKDGAQATIEGSAADWGQGDKTKTLRADKLTIGGKEYDLGQPRAFSGGRQNQGRFAPRGHGRGRGWGHGGWQRQGCGCYE